jgi:hypothetical protein
LASSFRRLDSGSLDEPERRITSEPGPAQRMGETPCFVVTHNQPTASHPPVFTFVTDGVVSAMFGTLDASINLERIEARATPAATHISFRVIQ